MPRHAEAKREGEKNMPRLGRRREKVASEAGGGDVKNMPRLSGRGRKARFRSGRGRC